MKTSFSRNENSLNAHEQGLNLTLKIADLDVAISDRAHKSKIRIVSSSWTLRYCTKLLAWVLSTRLDASFLFMLSSGSIEVSFSSSLPEGGSNLPSVSSWSSNIFFRMEKLSVSSVTAMLQKESKVTLSFLSDYALNCQWLCCGFLFILGFCLLLSFQCFFSHAVWHSSYSTEFANWKPWVQVTALTTSWICSPQS